MHVNDLVKLDANENLYGPHPDVAAAIAKQQAAHTPFSHFPSITFHF